MDIRQAQPGDGSELADLMTTLDEETKFMMLEPGERQTSAAAQEEAIKAFQSCSSKVMFVAEQDSHLVGFVVGVGNLANRNKHSMYCVIGILQCAVGQGLGHRLMAALEAWARAHWFTRLELTVMTHNDAAKRLYLSRGFQIEGVKRHSLCVDGVYVDEFYMSKLLVNDVESETS